jgi:hypothetical protein
MRAWKAAFALAGLLALVQYLPVYYYSLQFNDFVQQQARDVRMNAPLKAALLDKAKEYSLPIRDADINITRSGGVLRIAVDYRVTVTLLLSSPQLKFNRIGAGFLPE